MRWDDLRTLPVATALWAIAALGVLAGAAAAIAASALLLVLTLTIVVLLTAGGPSRAVFAHCGMFALLSILLVPALLRVESTADELARAADTGAIVTLEVRATTIAQSSPSGPEWAKESRWLQARTVPGVIRIGREDAPLRARVPLLLSGNGAAARELSAVRMGEDLTVRGTIRADGDRFALTVRSIEILPAAPGRAAAISARDLLRDGLRDATAQIPADEAALVRGMTNGDTEGLSERSDDMMRRAGITHLVAVSGSNLALVLGVVLIALLLTGVRRRPRLVAATLFTAGYVWLVGDEPSVQRAATMAAPLLAARFAGYRASPVAALALTLALWSIADPVTACSAGFALSALATASILIAARPAARAVHELTGERISPSIALVLTVPLLAQLICTPILILLTPEISIWAVAVNILVGPLAGPVTVLGLIATVLAPLIPAAAAALCWVAAGGSHLVLLISRAADALPGSRIPVPEGPPGVGFAIGAIAIAAVILVGRRAKLVRWFAVALLVAGTGGVIGASGPVAGGAPWVVAMCAIGQGDAILLRAAPQSDAETVLIDTGPDPEPLRECLDRLDVQQIDLLILTHPHADHTGGRAALIGGRAPRTQWICPLPEAAGQVLAAAGGDSGDGRGAARPVVRGEQWSAPELDIDVLWPPSAQAARSASAREDGAGEGDAANDCSVSISATWRSGMRMVSLGDLEPVAQRELARLAPGRADVVKVAHHGSRRQHEGLYAQLQSRLALVPVGQRNSFGHPTRQTLDLLHGLGAQVVRTDVHGTVLVPADPTDLPRSVGAPR